MRCWDHVGCELCVTQLLEISRFLADEGLLILGFVWLAIEYVGKESESSKALTSSPIVRGITFLVFSARIFDRVVIVPCFIRPY